VLERRGRAVDAVQAAVEVLEDSPYFNSGRGAVETADGTVELDAAIMDGTGRRAGACAAVRGIRHPVQLARTILDGTPHVLMVGEGAERVADEAGLERVPPEYFERAQGLSGPEAIPVGEGAAARAAALALEPAGNHPRADEIPFDEAETVGAVAMDYARHVASATSTGGMRGQLPGRVGDAPIPGAGTYAEDGVCAVSATGDGEAFITAFAAHEVATMMRHANLPIEECCRLVLRGRIGGTGGMVGIAFNGDVTLPFTTPAMARGMLRVGDPPLVAIGPEDLA
jgi:beta-aspartyl-peptidase (threonine type)